MQSTLLGNPNPCDVGSPLNEPTESISWTNFAGGIYTRSLRQHICDPNTQTPQIITTDTEGFWRADDTGCVRAHINEQPWSAWVCSPDAELDPVPRSRPWERLSRSGEIQVGGLSYQFSETRETKARLETGGPLFSLRKRFWGIHATATDFGDGFTPGTNVPPEMIKVMGKTLNSNGWAFFLLQDRTTNDVTPALPPEVRNSPSMSATRWRT